jgi:Cys-tRNA(Pro)/Cys-tRNA(Cys) deacylase
VAETKGDETSSLGNRANQRGTWAGNSCRVDTASRSTIGIDDAAPRAEPGSELAVRGSVIAGTISGFPPRCNIHAYNDPMSAVNNVTRFLDARKIRYAAFELPAEKLSAQDVAELLGVSQGVVFKTIVVKREKPKRPLLVLVPAAVTVDLKQVAEAVGDKKVYLPTEREAETLTGLQAGGISPLALINRGFDVLVDIAARELDEIHISGGQRGLNIRMAVSDLVQLTRGRFAYVGRPGNETDAREQGGVASP